MTDETPTRLTRQQAAEFLTRRGYPIRTRYFQKLCLPGCGQGPKIDTFFGGKALYLPADLLEWARSRCRSPGKAAA